MPTHPYRESRSTLRHGRALHERINDPETVTSLHEVVVDIIREEVEVKKARKREKFLVPMVADPCGSSPTTAHWWVYPVQGKRGQPWCRYCGEYR